jgi:hypothetical protein
MRNVASVLIAIGLIFHSVAALAAADPALTCQTGKLVVAGKYGACRLSAEAKSLKAGSSPDFTKCAITFSTKWGSAEAKAVGACLDVAGDEASIDARITTQTGAIATLLSGGTPVECGNGVIDGSDQCEGADLGGATCQGLGYTLGGTLGCTAGCAFDTSGCVTEHIPATGQTSSYGAGDDGAVRAGATQTFVDNGNGTITDSNTGLMWEAKLPYTTGNSPCTDETGTCANPHTTANEYTWSAAGDNNYDGTVVTIFLNQLNNRCNNDTAIACTVSSDCSVPGGACGFAGHRDWRLPNKNELLSIIDNSTAYPAVASAFYYGDASNNNSYSVGRYWSATTFAYGGGLAWAVDTFFGATNSSAETQALYARAVRGGS